MNLGSLLEESGLGLVIVSRKGTILQVNPAFLRMTGFSEDEVREKPLADFLPSTGRVRFLKLMKKAWLISPPTFQQELQFFNRKGKRMHFMAFAKVFGSAGRGSALGLIFVDITGLKKGQKKLQDLLREKEILLKEIHHRIKNNMQIIASLLRLQAGAVEDEKTKEVLKVSQSRIRSVSLIHEKLYQSQDLSRIDFGEYLRLLTAHLFHLSGADPAAVRVEIQAPQVVLDVKRAIPCGLIVNELVMNALKYAFPQGRRGRILVSMEELGEGHYTLSVNDDGVGLPERIDPKKPERLGFQIIADLIKQLDGKMEIDRKAGTSFSISF